MMTCKQIAELATAYAEGQLDLAERVRFQVHLGLCANCRTWVRQLQATARSLGKLPAPELPQELEAELLRRFEGWKAMR
jgi:anti-sigma factor ChrR (cupin superfamily)